ncbi:MAG TPA: Rieske 2Fe-2S domain-containing protein [Thermoanaerobaculia bacterium]|nr:Rieske 2Fe-2S domain-containing protein [Thermoanaerobaculia bacterium]
MNDDLIDIGSMAELPVGRARAFTIAGRRIAVYHTATGFFASDNECPHRGGPLGEGDLLGGEIVCPWHLWGFDVESGICAGNPEVRITTHRVIVDGDRLLVSLVHERETSNQP